MTQMYKVQIRDERGRWKEPRMNAFHPTLEAAKKRITMCDPDGMFLPDARILGPDGFMYGFADWQKERAGGD